MTVHTSFVRIFQLRHPTLGGELRSGGNPRIDLLQIDLPRGETFGEPSPTLSIGLTLRGSSRVSIDAGAGRFTEHCRPGYLIVNAPNAPTHQVNESPVRVLGLSVPWSRVESLCADLGRPGPASLEGLHAKGQHDRFIDGTMRLLWEEVASSSPLGLLFTEGTVDLIALRLLQLAGSAVANQPSPMGLAPWQVRRAVEFLETHFADNLSLSMVAQVVQLSPFHFARGFKLATGMPPHAYLRRIRCDRARQLLDATDLAITEIAARVGYETPQAFARMFRAETGASPTGYRRERRS